MSDRHEFVRNIIAPLRVHPGHRVRLGEDWDPSDTFGLLTRETAGERLAEGVQLLEEYQQRLAAQSVYAVLLIIQGIDAAGKDGTIKHVMSGVNPQGVDVHAFKVPSADDLTTTTSGATSDLPARGRIGIFNRSYYEEVAWCGCTRTSSPTSRCPTPGAAPPLGAPLPRDQRLGALPHRQRHPRGQGLPARLP